MCGTAALLARFGGLVEINHVWLKQKSDAFFIMESYSSTEFGTT